MNVQLPRFEVFTEPKSWADALVHALTQAFQEVVTVPQGGIIARETALPGWRVCDGTDGTPNLTASNLPGLVWIQKA